MTTAPFATQAASHYHDNARRQVPGMDGLHRMVNLLIEEHVPHSGKVLVLGAGGGLELRAMAEFNPEWSFHGIDPSADMLALARRTTEEHAARVDLTEGYIQQAPMGPFDAAISLLTFHFIAREERLETLRQLRSRLRPGAPLVIAHISFEQSEPARSQWIARHVAYGGTDKANVDAARPAIGTRLSILPPEEEVALLQDAGFAEPSLFYAAFSFKGWVATAK